MKRYNIIVFASILGLLWTSYLLYNKGGGLSKSDIVIIILIIIFLAGLLRYFKKQKQNQ
jgi:hypothetical protein